MPTYLFTLVVCILEFHTFIIYAAHLITNVNVYTPFFLDQTNWPAAVGAYFIDINGVKIQTPRVATKLELIIDLSQYIFYTILDVKHNYLFIISFLEFLATKIYIWIISISHKAFIDELTAANLVDVEFSLYQPSDWLVSITNLYLYLVFFFFTLLYFYAYGLRNNSSHRGLTEGGIFLYAYLDEVEEECGQLEDGITYLLYFAVFVLWFYFFNIFAAAIILKHINWLLTLFCFILILGIVIPGSLLTQVGLAFAQYIRGAGRGTSLIFETLLDFVSVSVIVIRFFVQNVRFVFIFVGFFEYYEYIDSQIYPLNNLLIPQITWRNYWQGDYSSWYWFELFLQFFVQVVSYIYYVGHLTITYIAQLSIYIILSFWIYFFLYTTFALPSQEKYFYFKRYALLLK